MTYYLGKVGRAGSRILSSCKDLYNDVNAAYLTGAVDIVVVKQKDGSLKSTPFHVRFGKLGVLRTGDLKEVEVEINGKPVDLNMKVDATGRGFFPKNKQCESGSDSDSEKTETDTESLLPLLSQESTKGPHECPTESPDTTTPTNPQDGANPLESQERAKDEDHTELSRLESETGLTQELVEASPAAKSSPVEIERGALHEVEHVSLPIDMEVMSDSGLDSKRSEGLLSSPPPVSALSDTEVEVKDRLSSKLWEWSGQGRVRQASWGEPSTSSYTDSLEADYQERLKPQRATVDRTGLWSALTGILNRRSSRRTATSEDGIYLDDIDNESMDPDELSKFFPSSYVASEPVGVADQAGSSGIGSSPTLSPSQSNYDMNKEENYKLVSMLDNCAFSLCGGLGEGSISEEQFQSSQISFPQFCSDPGSLFLNPNLVVRVNGHYYNWQTAAALVMSSVVFLQVPPDSTQEAISKKLMPKKLSKSQKSYWWWGRWSKDSGDEDVQSKAKSEGATPVGSPHKWEHRERNDSVRTDNMSSDDEQEVLTGPMRPRQRSLKKKPHNTILTSEQLSKLPLKCGANTVVFSITTKYQGTTKAQCTLYLWNYYDKVVVSDVDGTITRSDVAGQVLPLLGKDWTQNGVVELFSSILKNGYHILYLSARAIGQAGYTKEFLRNVKRGQCGLPDGPLFLAPFSLYIAFKKEVIEKKPEEFKIECLKEIRSLFPADFNPFHAGFGNKPSDAKSYIEVDIQQSRIFTVNPKGHLRNQLSIVFQSNYMNLKVLVDAQFPPLKFQESLSTEDTDSSISEAEIDASNIKEDFNMFNYWTLPPSNKHYLDLDEVGTTGNCT